MAYLMGIDLGSTSLKAVVYDLDGHVVASGSRATEKVHPSKAHPEWAVWLPEQIWGGIAEAIREAVGQLDDPADVKGVPVTGMGMDGVPMDSEGKWLYPFISWHDPRTAVQLEWWKANIGAAKVFSIGGNPLWAINSALRILWMKENEPAILAKTDKWLLIEDFVNFMLCGRRATDYSMASCTLLFDQKKLDWSDEMLALSGIDRGLMPDIFASGTPLGEVHGEAAARTGLPVGTPVILGGHDHLCGALPVGAFQSGTVLDVTGTWEIVMVPLDGPVLSDDIRQAGVTVQSHVARGMYSAWGSTPAGDSLEWFRKNYGFEARQKASEQGGDDWDYLVAEAAASPVGANGAMFLPHLSAVSCPIEDARALGAFVGLSNRVSRGDMLRAIFEALDYQFLDIVRSMETALGHDLEKFIAVGGAVRNEFWMQNKANVIGRPVEVPDVHEATPLGAAILAGIGVGLYPDCQHAFERVYKKGKTYLPDASLSEQYAKRFEIYKQLYPQLQTISHQISELD
ncbi:MAG: hypothetical protein K9M57_03255 [Phycisphaerae bacterium]|nr:hypothetical protein [Phycisphaerae bacterium]